MRTPSIVDDDRTLPGGTATDPRSAGDRTTPERAGAGTAAGATSPPRRARVHGRQTGRSNNRVWIAVIVAVALISGLWLIIGGGRGRQTPPPSATRTHHPSTQAPAKQPASSITFKVVPVQHSAIQRAPVQHPPVHAPVTTAPSDHGAAKPPVANVNAPPADSGAWSVVFDDEFNGNAIDPSKWSSCYTWGCTNSGNPETEWYESKNSLVRGGDAELFSEEDRSHGKLYTSGLIQTNGHFSFRYGYAEIRVRLPGGKGSWPAFWMLPTNLSFPPEIDVFESWGSHPDLIMNGVHYGASADANVLLSVPNLHAGFHTFAVDWEPHSITWYIDGVKTYSVNLSISARMYLIANVAQLATPAANGTTGYPATMSIDYVRVWQHK